MSSLLEVPVLGGGGGGKPNLVISDELIKNDKKYWVLLNIFIIKSYLILTLILMNFPENCAIFAETLTILAVTFAILL